PDGCEMRFLRYCRSLLFRTRGSRQRPERGSSLLASLRPLWLSGGSRRGIDFQLRTLSGAHRLESRNRRAAKLRATTRRTPGGCRMVERPDRQAAVLALETE